MKCGKAAGIDGITPENGETWTKCSGTVVDNDMWPGMETRRGTRRVENAVIVPLHKGKGNKDECKNYRGISLLSVPGKICGRILTDRLMQVTEKKVSDEQGGFRKGKSCVDLIFAVKMLVEEYLRKDRKLYAALMDLEKAYDMVNREALWNVLKIYGVGGQLMEGIIAFIGRRMCNSPNL